MTPAEELLAAADKLDALLAKATPGPWSADPTGTVCADSDLRPDGRGGEILPEDGPMEVAECYRSEGDSERGHNAAYIAAMNPDVGRALAALLRNLAVEYSAKGTRSWLGTTWGLERLVHAILAINGGDA